MVAGRGLGHGGKAAVVPRKLARLDDDAAHGGPMPTDEFGRRMDADGCTPKKRLAQIRTGKCVVNEKRHTCLVTDLGNGFDVQHIQRGVAQGFRIQGFGFRCDGTGKILRVRGVHKHGFNAELFEVHTQLRVCATV